MKTWLLSLGFLAALPLAAAAQASVEDLRKLAAAGVGDDVILAFVRAHGAPSKLGAGEVAELKKAGVSDRVLQSLIGTPSEAPAPAPERATERVVERPVYVPRTYFETEPYYPVSYSYASYPSYYSYPGYSYRPFYGGWHYPSYGYGYCGSRYGYGYGSGWGVGVGYYGGRWGVGVGFRW